MATVERAFIIDVGGEAGVGDGVLSGHVEHVATGQACDFTNLQDLADFIIRTIGLRPGEEEQ